jgi:hypothetical protein
MVGDLGDELDALALGSVVDAALHDAAAVSMGSHFHAAGRNRIVDELVVLRLERVEALLNDVVAVQVLNQCDDVLIEGRNQGLDLALGRQVVDQALDRSSAMTARALELHQRRAPDVHIERDADQIIVDARQQYVLLLVGRVFEEALSQVVAEAVDHELRKVRIDLGEDHIAVERVALFQLALQEAAAVLVLAEASHVPLQIFKAQAGKAIGCENPPSQPIADEKGRLTIVHSLLAHHAGAGALRAHTTRPVRPLPVALMLLLESTAKLSELGRIKLLRSAGRRSRSVGVLSVRVRGELVAG